jgi:hypothetical protein
MRRGLNPVSMVRALLPEEARRQLRNWRISASADYYRTIKREFDDAGVTIFTYYVGFNESYSDAEIDATFEGASILGAKGCVGSFGLAMAHHLAPFPGRHGMFLGLHNQKLPSVLNASGSERLS